MRKKKSSGASEWVDPDDAPELTAEHFERADIYEGERLVRRGRPPIPDKKEPLKLRLRPAVIEHFRSTGPGWQTRMSDILEKAATKSGAPARSAGRDRATDASPKRRRSGEI